MNSGSPGGRRACPPQDFFHARALRQLYRQFRRHGMPRTSLRSGMRRWMWVVIHRAASADLARAPSTPGFAPEPGGPDTSRGASRSGSCTSDHLEIAELHDDGHERRDPGPERRADAGRAARGAGRAARGCPVGADRRRQRLGGCDGGDRGELCVPAAIARRLGRGLGSPITRATSASRLATGRHILLCDADATRSVSTGFGSCARSCWMQSWWAGRCSAIRRAAQVSWSTPSCPRTAFAPPRAPICGFKRSVWEALGGFDEAYRGGDDTEFFWRAQLAGTGWGMRRRPCCRNCWVLGRAARATSTVWRARSSTRSSAGTECLVPRREIRCAGGGGPSGPHRRR